MSKLQRFCVQVTAYLQRSAVPPKQLQVKTRGRLGHVYASINPECG